MFLGFLKGHYSKMVCRLTTFWNSMPRFRNVSKRCYKDTKQKFVRFSCKTSQNTIFFPQCNNIMDHFTQKTCYIFPKNCRGQKHENQLFEDISTPKFLKNWNFLSFFVLCYSHENLSKQPIQVFLKVITSQISSYFQISFIRAHCVTSKSKKYTQYFSTAFNNPL